MRIRFLLRLAAMFRHGFFADEGTGGGGAGDTGTGDDTGQGGTGDTGDQSGDTGSAGDTGDVAFTPAQQAHIDKLIGKAKGTAKTAAEKELKTWLEQQSMTESDRLKAEKAQLEQEREAARAEILTTKIETAAERAAIAAGVKPDRVDRFLRLVDLTDRDELTADGKPDGDAITAAVAKALADVPEFKGEPAKPSGSSGSDGMNGNGDRKTWTRDEIAKMSVADFEKHEDEINAALAGGRVN